MGISAYREWMGDHEFMKQIDREYLFPVDVYKEEEDGSRTLLRSEARPS
jgi:hypothetical protein